MLPSLVLVTSCVKKLGRAESCDFLAVAANFRQWWFFKLKFSIFTYGSF